MDQRLQILCNKFLDQRYYFEYDICSEEKKVFDIFLQEKHNRRYPFGILQYNCEKEVIKAFSLTDEESFDVVKDWVILNTNQMVEDLQKDLYVDEAINILGDISSFYLNRVSLKNNN